MDEQLQHDPRSKSQVKDALYYFLYTPVLKQFENQLENLIIKNTIAIGGSHKSFWYKDKLYTCDTATPPRKLNRLAPQFKAEMDTYLTEIEQLNSYELPRVLGFITKVLNTSNSLTDYLEVLPTAVHRPLQQLIATCPCRTKSLSPDSVKELQDSNQVAIALLKQRLVTNMLI